MIYCFRAKRVMASLGAGVVRQGELRTRLARVRRGEKKMQHYRGKVNAPEFPVGLDWLNTTQPLRMADLRGKIVLLEFWTFC